MTIPAINNPGLIPSLVPTFTAARASRARQARVAMAPYQITVSPAWEHAEACYAEAVRISHAEAPALTGLPKDPAKLEAALRDRARAVGDHAALVAAAAEAANFAQHELEVELDRALPGWYDLLSDRFAEASLAFTTSDAPPELTGSEDEATVAAHLAKKRAASQLSYLATSRVLLGSADGEVGGNDLRLWLVAEPPGPDTDAELLQRWVELDDAYPRSIAPLPPAAKWQLLHDRGVELSLAARGQVAARTATWWDAKRGAAGQPQLTPIGQQQRLDARASLSLSRGPG